MVRKLVVLALAMIAVRLAGRAMKNQADLVKILWLMIASTATLNATNTPKARSTEERLNTLITAVFPNTGGTVNGSMTVNGNHQVNGTASANTVKGTSQVLAGGASGSNALEVNGGAHVNSNMQVDGSHSVGGQLSVAGGSGGATVAVAGSVHASSTGQFDGGLSTSAINIGGSGSGATVAVNGNIHTSSTGQFDGGISAANFSGSFAGGQGYPGHVAGSPFNASQFSSLASCINAVMDACRDAGVMA